MATPSLAHVVAADGAEFGAAKVEATLHDVVNRRSVAEDPFSRLPLGRTPPAAAALAAYGVGHIIEQGLSHGSERDLAELRSAGIVDQLGRQTPSPQAENAQVIIVLSLILLGCALWIAGLRGQQDYVYGIVGLILVYFGVNIGFSFYMKYLLSDREVSKELGLQGVPAAFLITAFQQVESFVAFSVAIVALWPTCWRYTPGSIKCWQTGYTLIFFSLSFALNIGLNNLSLTLLPVSLNMTIRSCLPLMTLAVQVLFRQLRVFGDEGPITCIVFPNAAEASRIEVGLMAVGVCFAALATWAKGSDPYHATGDAYSFKLGVVTCIFSVLAAAFNLVLAGVLGSRGRLSPLDSTMYMALPSALFLLPGIFYLPHPAQWPGNASLTDWQVWGFVKELSPGTSIALLISGCLAISNNLLQYWLVQRLNATHSAFAGNVTKAVTITFSIMLGVETLPGGFWSVVMLLSVTGNIASFMGYTMVKARRGFSMFEDKDDSSTACSGSERYRRGARGSPPRSLSTTSTQASGDVKEVA